MKLLRVDTVTSFQNREPNKKTKLNSHCDFPFGIRLKGIFKEIETWDSRNIMSV